MRKLLNAFTLSALLVFAPLTALAETYPECTSEPSEEEVEAAKGAFMAGKAAFDEADYERAISYWSDAYRRDCTAHDLLRNLARAYELSGKKEAAIEALQTYLERVPDTPKREQFERRIDKLQAQVEDEAQAPAEPVAEVTPEPTTTPAPVTTAAPPPESSAPRGKKPLAPLIVVAAGSSLAVVGGVAYLAGLGKASDYEDQCGSTRSYCPSTEVQQEASDWRSHQIAYSVTAWAGAGIAATGLVWYLAAPRKQASTTTASVTVRPGFAPGYGGVAVKARF